MVKAREEEEMAMKRTEHVVREEDEVTTYTVIPPDKNKWRLTQVQIGLLALAVILGVEIASLVLVRDDFNTAMHMCLVNDAYVHEWNLFDSDPYSLTIGQHLEQRDKLLAELRKYKEASAATETAIKSGGGELSSLCTNCSPVKKRSADDGYFGYFKKS